MKREEAFERADDACNLAFNRVATLLDSFEEQDEAAAALGHALGCLEGASVLLATSEAKLGPKALAADIGEPADDEELSEESGEDDAKEDAGKGS